MTKGGLTPLHLACSRGHIDLVFYFVYEEKVDPSILSASGETPLHLAVSKCHSDIVRYLLFDHQCDLLCFDRQGMSPLGLASKSFDRTIANLMTEIILCGNGPLDLRLCQECQRLLYRVY